MKLAKNHTKTLNKKVSTLKKFEIGQLGAWSAH